MILGLPALYRRRRIRPQDLRCMRCAYAHRRMPCRFPPSAGPIEAGSGRWCRQSHQVIPYLAYGPVATPCCRLPHELWPRRASPPPLRRLASPRRRSRFHCRCIQSGGHAARSVQAKPRAGPPMPAQSGRSRGRSRRGAGGNGSCLQRPRSRGAAGAPKIRGAVPCMRSQAGKEKPARRATAPLAAGRGAWRHSRRRAAGCVTAFARGA